MKGLSGTTAAGWQRALTCGWGEAALEDTNSIHLCQFLKQYLAQDGATGRSSDDNRARPLYADSQGSDIHIAHHTNVGGGGTDRSAGIKVISSTNVADGQVLDIVGRIQGAGVERYVTATSVH